ncbi:hypothetical protein JXO59_04250, partial [candidate division KSB1 bacterium]|nr:hypothetical protein [candidate division KSB1 bacterium]
ESVIIYYLGLNLRDPYLKHRPVRQAIAHAIDRQAMIDHLLKGHATLATGLLSPSNWAYEPDVRQYAYDLERANALLDEAGFPDPDGDGPQPRFAITYKTSTNPQSIRIGEIVQEQLKKVGIDVKEIQVLEFATFLDDVRQGNFQMFRLSWVGISDPNMFHTAYHAGMMPPTGGNYCFYANPRVDELTEQGQVTLDPGQRKLIYSEVQKILAEDVPYIYLWYPHNVVVMKANVQGFTPYPEGNFASLKDVWIEE